MSGVDGQGRLGDTVGVTARPVGDGDGHDGLCQCGHTRAEHNWAYDQCCSGSGPTKYGCGCPGYTAEPAPTIEELRAAIRPAPVSGDGQDGLREALAVIHAWDDDDNGTYADLAARFTAWAEQRARERAAEVVAGALRILDNYGQGGTYAADYIRALAADDRTGQR